jgi:hypothetical protein
VPAADVTTTMIDTFIAENTFRLPNVRFSIGNTARTGHCTEKGSRTHSEYFRAEPYRISRNGTKPFLPGKRKIKMKSVMKVMLVKAILFLMTSSAAAQINAYVDGSIVFSNNSSIAEVDVFRFQDPATGLITTNLFYNSCPQPSTNIGCQQGVGIIPNEAFQGTVYTQANRPDTLTLSVDTNAVVGFRNYICINDAFFYCAIQSPTTGGVVSMSWTRTNAHATVTASTEKDYQLGKLTTSESYSQSEFSAAAAGTFFGAFVSGPVTPTSVIMGTADNSQTLKTKFAALKSK